MRREKINKNLSKRKLLALGGTSLVLMFGLFGCGASSDTPDGSSDKPKVEDSQKEDARNFKIGDTYKKDDSYTIKVNKLENYTSKSEIMKPKEGQKFVVANITVENLGKEDLAVSSLLCFNLKNTEDGTKYDIAITDAGNQLDGSVAPGKKLTGNIAFSVPKDVTSVELEANLDVLGGKPVYFQGDIK